MRKGGVSRQKRTYPKKDHLLFVTGTKRVTSGTNNKVIGVAAVAAVYHGVTDGGMLSPHNSHMRYTKGKRRNLTMSNASDKPYVAWLRA